jgi:hypothetical protein
MADNGFPLFYDDINDAISKMVNGNPEGLSIKQIAMDLWPSRNPDTARSAFSRAINSEQHDLNLRPEEVVKVMEITNRPEDVIFFLCDRFGFERPSKKERKSIEKSITSGIKSIQDQMRALMKEVQTLERTKE